MLKAFLAIALAMPLACHEDENELRRAKHDQIKSSEKSAETTSQDSLAQHSDDSKNSMKKDFDDVFLKEETSGEETSTGENNSESTGESQPANFDGQSESEREMMFRYMKRAFEFCDTNVDGNLSFREFAVCQLALKRKHDGRHDHERRLFHPQIGGDSHNDEMQNTEDKQRPIVDWFLEERKTQSEQNSNEESNE